MRGNRLKLKCAEYSFNVREMFVYDIASDRIFQRIDVMKGRNIFMVTQNIDGPANSVLRDMQILDARKAAGVELARMMKRRKGACSMPPYPIGYQSPSWVPVG